MQPAGQSSRHHAQLHHVLNVNEAAASEVGRGYVRDLKSLALPLVCLARRDGSAPAFADVVPFPLRRPLHFEGDVLDEGDLGSLHSGFGGVGDEAVERHQLPRYVAFPLHPEDGGDGAVLHAQAAQCLFVIAHSFLDGVRQDVQVEYTADVEGSLLREAELAGALDRHLHLVDHAGVLIPAGDKRLRQTEREVEGERVFVVARRHVLWVPFHLAGRAKHVDLIREVAFFLGVVVSDENGHFGLAFAGHPYSFHGDRLVEVEDHLPTQRFPLVEPVTITFEHDFQLFRFSHCNAVAMPIASVLCYAGSMQTLLVLQLLRCQNCLVRA